MLILCDLEFLAFFCSTVVEEKIIMRPSSVGGGRILRRTLSVRLSVRPVPLLLTLEHRSRVFVNLADVRYLLFCLHARAAYCTAISAAQACSKMKFTMKIT